MPKAVYEFGTPLSTRRWSFLILAAILLSGCATPPSIRAWTRDVWKTTAFPAVLYRVTTEVNGESLDHPPYRLELAKIGTNEWGPVRLFSPSRQARDKGWGYFFLEPGRYRLLFTFPFFGYPSFEFRLSIPSEHSVIYAGSLFIRCRRESAFLFSVVVDCSEAMVSDESEAAEIIAQAPLGASRRISTHLLTVLTPRTLD